MCGEWAANRRAHIASCCRLVQLEESLDLFAVVRQVRALRGGVSP